MQCSTFQDGSLFNKILFDSAVLVCPVNISYDLRFDIFLVFDIAIMFLLLEQLCSFPFARRKGMSVAIRINVIVHDRIAYE